MPAGGPGVEELIRTAQADARLLADQGGDRSGAGTATSGVHRAEPVPQGLLPADYVPGHTLLRELHRGGQGVVYLAAQHSTGKSVAIKVLRAGHLASHGERVRLEREAQVLSELDDPQIVAIRDTGEADGLRYVIMDYVDGVPLDVFARSEKLDARGVLRLFVRVCEAVNAAHLRGVIHRDLKPGNILVDRSGVPRILDFGLAKSLAEEPGSVTVTQEGLFLGSLPWASPEQVAGEQSKVDLRTDVYSLGVILYQLLTGRSPFDAAGSLHAVIARIRQDAPTPPRRFCREIGDELQTIILKCLSKERERRYQSAGALRDDVRRFLENRPIEAKHDSLAYVASKFVRRHRAVVAGLSLALAGVLTGAFGTWRSVNEQRRSAESQAHYLIRLLSIVGTALEREDRAGERAVERLAQYLAELGENEEIPPEAEALVRHQAGATYSHLGRPEAARAEYTRSLALARTLPRSDHLIVDNLLELARLDGVDRPGSGWAHVEEALGVARNFRTPSPARLVECLVQHGNNHQFLGRPEHAENSYREALAVVEREDPRLIPRLAAYGGLLAAQGRFEESLRISERIVAVERESTEPRVLANVLQMHAITLCQAGRFADAEPVAREAVAIWSTVAERSPAYAPRIYATTSVLGSALLEQSRFEEAEVCLLEALRGYEPAGDPNLIRRMVEDLVSLYTSWHAADPRPVLEQQAAYWREYLNDPEAGDAGGP